MLLWSPPRTLRPTWPSQDGSAARRQSIASTDTDASASWRRYRATSTSAAKWRGNLMATERTIVSTERRTTVV